jgi:hypothetical protein
MNKIWKFLQSYLAESVLLFTAGILILIWHPGFFLGFSASLAALAVVLAINESFLARSMDRLWADISSHRPPLFFAAFVTILLAVWGFAAISVSFIFLLILFVLYRWDVKIAAGMATVFAVACLLMLIVGNEAYAEYFAEGAYFSLLLTVLLRIFQSRFNE